MSKREKVFCAVLNGKRTAITETGVKIGEWDEDKNKSWPGHSFYFRQFKKEFYDCEIVIVEDPGTHEEFIGACKAMETNSKAAREANKPEGPEEIILDLPVMFNDQKLAEFARRMSDLQMRKMSKEVEKKNTMSEYKAEIDGLDEDISKLAIKVEKGEEMTSVKCRVERDEKGTVVSVCRQDTGEIVEGIHNFPTEQLEIALEADTDPADQGQNTVSEETETVVAAEAVNEAEELFAEISK